MQKYLVVGHPIDHSLSPLIQGLFAEQCGLSDFVYETHDVEPGGFIEAMAVLRRDNSLQGLNVTLPFKMDAADYCDKITDRARAAGAVNTICIGAGYTLGDNTDGVGLERDIEKRGGIQLKGQRVLVIGAGGAARGVISHFKTLGCAKIDITNRTFERAVALAMDLGVTAVNMLDTASGGYDVIINATSASLSPGSVPAIPNGAFKDCKLAVDLVYGALPTAFMRLALDSGAESAQDGLGMLVEQAAESFRLWTGTMPETESVCHKVREMLTNH